MKRSLTMPALLMSGIILISACSGIPDREQQQPDWLDGPSADYPQKKFLTGIGESRSMSDARNRARADLAKIFEVRITADTRDTQSYVRKQTGDVIDTDSSLSITRNIETRTEKIIRGIRIADTWYDREANRHHALAVLPRASTIQRLRQEINQLDEATRVFLSDADRERDPLDRAGYINRALGTQIERNSVQQSLTIVDKSGKGLPSKWNIKTLATELLAALGNMHIRSELESSMPDNTIQGSDLLTIINGAIGNSGFSVATDGNENLVLLTSIEIADLGKRDGWHWSRATVEISLLDSKNRKVRGSKRWPLKVSVPEGSNMAGQRLLNKIDQTLNKELRGIVLGFSGN